MYAQENPVVHQLAPNTPAQNAELADRELLTLGIIGMGLTARRIISNASRQRLKQRTALSPAHSWPLQAPYGQYQPLLPDQANIVAVHINESGKIEAFGPFSETEEAYDYFPKYSSPHDTTILVFEVFADRALC